MIRGDYWIKAGRISSVVGGEDRSQHDEVAHNFISKKYVDELISYGNKLGINTFLYDIHSSKSAGFSASGMIEKILKKLMLDKKRFPNIEDAGAEIQRVLGIDKELLSALSDVRGAMIYVLKHFNWIAVREMNVELYGLDYEKGKVLSRGLKRIFEREKLLESGDMVFTIFDHKTGRTINVSYEDILDGNFFKAGEIPSARSTYVPVPKNWRGTSEGVSLDFRNFMISLL
jgi:hypothetical protein